MNSRRTAVAIGIGLALALGAGLTVTFAAGADERGNALERVGRMLGLVGNLCGGGNETSAISTLRNVSAAQEQFRASCVADEDGDDRGEFGCFGELSGAVAIRAHTEAEAADAPGAAVEAEACAMPAAENPRPC